MSRTSSEEHANANTLADEAVLQQLDALRSECDQLRARLVSLEARRADLVAHVLEVAASQPKGEALVRRLETLVDELVSLDLRCPRPIQPPATAEVPRPVAAGEAATVELDAVVFADGSLLDLRRCLQALKSRTPELRSVQLVALGDGPTVTKLGELVAERDCWAVAPEGEHGIADVDTLVAAVSAGSAPYVALLSSRVIATHGWSSRLRAVLDRDDALAAAIPLSDAGDAPGAIRLPPRPRFGPDGIALLVEHARVDPPGPPDSLAVPCCVLRRAAAADLIPRVARGTVEAILEGYGDQIRAGGGQLGFAVGAYVHVEPRATVPDPPRRGRQAEAAPRAGSQRSPAWSSAATDLIRECGEVPELIGDVLAKAGGVTRVAYVAGAAGGHGAANAAMEVSSLRLCGIEVELLLLGDEPATPWPDARYVGPDGLASALEYVDVAIVAGSDVVQEVSAAAQRAGTPCAYLVTEYDGSVPDGLPLLTVSTAVWERLGPERRRAIPMAPMFNDRAFRPLPDQGSSEARFTVLARLRPATAASTLEALEEVRRTLGDRSQVLTLGPPTDALIARGCAPGAWEASHHVPPGGSALARLLNSVDVYVDVTSEDLTGRDVLAAMACGAVAIIGAQSAGTEISRGGRSAVAIPDAAPSDATVAQAAVDLATDWPCFRRLRHQAMSTSAQHGLLGGAAGRLMTIRSMRETFATR